MFYKLWRLIQPPYLFQSYLSQYPEKRRLRLQKIQYTISTGSFRKAHPFSDLASKYSDHKQSAARGGKLGWFGSGELIPELSEAACAIKDTGLAIGPSLPAGRQV